MKAKTVSVYGYGRFGRLWADILAKDFHVKVYSRRGLTEEEVSEGLEITTKEGVFDSDVVFFCVAISAFEKLLIDSKQFFKPGTLFIDTCSVKVYPAQWMKKYLPENSEIIATHPMFGPDSYCESKEKFPMVMSDVRTKKQTFEDWKQYFMNKNMYVEKMSPDEHDEKVAYSQGITHYVGRVLADLNLQPNNISTFGYDKLLEIIEQTCNDSWQLFLDLQRYNPYTKKMRKDLYDSVLKIYGVFDFKNGES